MFSADVATNNVGAGNIAGTDDNPPRKTKNLTNKVISRLSIVKNAIAATRKKGSEK
jgi:hypothetical protein